jgi:hypothetical protein
MQALSAPLANESTLIVSEPPEVLSYWFVPSQYHPSCTWQSEVHRSSKRSEVESEQLPCTCPHRICRCGAKNNKVLSSALHSFRSSRSHLTFLSPVSIIFHISPRSVFHILNSSAVESRKKNLLIIFFCRQLLWECLSSDENFHFEVLTFRYFRTARKSWRWISFNYEFRERLVD